MPAKGRKKAVKVDRTKVVDPSLKLRTLKPLTPAQEDTFEAYEEGLNLFLYGSAGTGKTLLSLYLAFRDVLNPDSPYSKVIVIRSAVPSRNLGALPGTLKEKIEIYSDPYRPLLNFLFQRGDAFSILESKGLFEVQSTSYLRGITYNNAIIVADECQNFSFSEADTTISRVGHHCKFIFSGDLAQTDLHSKNDTSGFPKFFQIISEMPDFFDVVQFLPEDIVRSGLVKSYIITKERLSLCA